MALFTYAPNAVLDPVTGEPILLGNGKVYLPNDAGFTSPLITTKPSGATTTEVQVRNGASESFMLDDVMACIWVDDENPSLTSALQPILPGVPAGGSMGQVLGKTTNSDYDLEWVDGPAGGGGGPGSMIVVNQSGTSYTRPSSDPNIVYVFTGTADPGSVALENDRWDRIV